MAQIKGNGRADAPLSGGTTGRYLVLLEEGAQRAAKQELADKAGIRVEGKDAFMEMAAVAEPEELGPGSVLFEQLGIAIVSAEPGQYSRMLEIAASEASPVMLVEPERVVYAFANGPQQHPRTPMAGRGVQAAGSGFWAGALTPPPRGSTEGGSAGPASAAFLLGYRAGVDQMVESLLERDGITTVPTPPTYELEPTVAGSTWGLVATRVDRSTYSGKGVKVAVLDTGMDLQHPDFAGRELDAASFVTGQAVQDAHGHGTHCIGTACGPLAPSGLTSRYGVAYDADICAGKVLSNSGRGTDGAILAGIDWAIERACAVISMSLGAIVEQGQGYSQIFETVARRAARRGTLIIAAAGNESERPGLIRPVGHPANCPSIMAVAALDRHLRVASFSNGSINPDGGEVNIAGPGVDVRSSWPMPARYRSLAGTSMATPHVSGIAALYAQATGKQGLELAQLVLQGARRLTPTSDFGWGLVQAP